MATLVLPVRYQVPNQFFRVELEGVVYGFELRWNHRCDRWALNLLDSGGNPLALGRRLCLGTFLLPEPRRPEYPPGGLLVVDEGEGVEPTLATLGSTTLLVYVETEGV